MFGHKAQKKSEQTNWDRQKALILQALNQLSPENIASLQKLFLPYIQQQMNASGQGSIAALKRSQAGRGLLGSGFGLSQEAGLRGMMGSQAVTQAFQNAMGLAGQRANAWLGQGTPQVQPNMNMANAFQNAISSGFLGASLYGKGGGKTPYNTSGAPWTMPGWQPTPTWGLPPNQEPSLF